MKKFWIILLSFILIVFLAYYSRTQKQPYRKPLPPKKIEERRPAKEEKSLIASYSTQITGNAINLRSQNMRSAVNLINGRRLNPGDEFSFNSSIGSITKEKGFVPAPIIDDDGTMKPGLGGGMCQVTSTLYNTVLESGLEILERHPHSKKVTYVPEGRDATVYDDKDFRFRNNKKKPVQITGQVVNNKVTMNIYQITSVKQ